MKKTSILIILFVFPLVAYLFFASGINNFGVLPTLNDQVKELPLNKENVQFEDHISILSILGSDLEFKKANAFNLNQKIYKRFYEFKDFQFVVLVSESARLQVEAILSELESLGDNSKWNFVYLEESQIQELYSSLETVEDLDANAATNHVFIIDKNRSQRGRTTEDEKHPLPSYDATSIATLTNIMIDDVKILLAEYRLALKRNNADRK
jgi:hypothetical protein